MALSPLEELLRILDTGRRADGPAIQRAEEARRGRIRKGTPKLRIVAPIALPKHEAPPAAPVVRYPRLVTVDGTKLD